MSCMFRTWNLWPGECMQASEGRGEGGRGEHLLVWNRADVLSPLLNLPLLLSRARANSYMDAYFVFPNGSALMLSQLSS